MAIRCCDGEYREIILGLGIFLSDYVKVVLMMLMYASSKCSLGDFLTENGRRNRQDCRAFSQQLHSSRNVNDLCMYRRVM